MNPLRKSILTLFIGACAIANSYAAVKDLPVRTVNGRMYHYYEVPSKETVYSICYKLGVSKEEVVKYNPAVADGLKPGMTLFFPVENESPATSSSPAGMRIINHKVEKGETIFGISRRYGVTTECIIEQNPILQQGLKAGQTIRITVPAEIGTGSEPEQATPATSIPQPAQQVVGYVVKKKETFYSIAHDHGISVAQLEAANPGVASLKTGQVLNIPVAATPVAEVPADNTGDEDPTPIHETSSSPSETDLAQSHSGTQMTDKVNGTTTDADSIHTEETVGKISVAVMLPFMLEEETPSKNAMRFTEFYKGFLIAVDSLRNCGIPVEVAAYDTEGSVLKVRDHLTDPGFQRHGAIIAPDNTSQLAIIGEYAKDNGMKVFNTFIVRDDSYLTNPAMMQGNLPSTQMYQKAIDALVTRLDYSIPVFISFNGQTGDKADFISELRGRLDARGKTYMDIKVDSRLSVSDLKALPSDGSYTFIPSSSRQADLNKIMPGIIEWRDESGSPAVKMFGYPEWTAFRGETRENMHNLNTIVYSRFFNDDESPRALELEGKFKQWYGVKMENAVPRQGLLGFDTGMFLLEYMRDPSTRYDGIQNGYSFSSPAENGGAYNDVLYFINFRPGGSVERVKL